MDAAQNIVPGSTQRVDTSQPQFITRVRGHIENGVLTTEPTDVLLPFHSTNVAGEQKIRGMRLKLTLSPGGAKGIMAGYYDLKRWWNNYSRSYVLGTNVGAFSCPSTYQAAHQLADGYPDPRTGECTAISGTAEVEFVRAYIQHAPEDRPSSAESVPSRSRTGQR